MFITEEEIKTLNKDQLHWYLLRYGGKPDYDHIWDYAVHKISTLTP